MVRGKVVSKSRGGGTERHQRIRVIEEEKKNGAYVLGDIDVVSDRGGGKGSPP